MDRTETELERFRQQWREEVSARKTKGKSTEAASSQTAPRRHNQAASTSRLADAPPQMPVRTAEKNPYEGWDEVQLHTYHDLDEHVVTPAAPSSRSKEPRTPPQSALEHYEEAVAKEVSGNLGDSINLYRKAFRIDSSVHETYKKKHFSHAWKSKATGSQPSNASSVPNPEDQDPADSRPLSYAGLLQECAHSKIIAENPPTEFSPPPPCPIAFLPEELLVEILAHLANFDVASYARAAQVCKRFAYLITTEESIWKRVCDGHRFGFPAMHYRFACTIRGESLTGTLLGTGPVDDLAQAYAELSMDDPPRTEVPMVLSPTYPTYRHMFRTRPRIRFNGCYISTVNYTRPGSNATSHATWNSPVLVVTYYRYLRFFRDGSVISLLTTTEPAEVIPVLHQHNLPSKTERTRRPHHPTPTHDSHGPDGELHPSSKVMKHALRGRWRLSDPITEGEGDLHVETEGAVPKYTFKMQFTLSSGGRGARNNKLTWKGFWSYNTVTDDWGEVGLKNDKRYWWSRVKSWDV